MNGKSGKAAELFENLGKWLPQENDGEGVFNIPMIKREEMPEAKAWMPFSEIKRTVPDVTGIHFFIDDYRFERIWNQPERYLERLKKAACVCAPDFSMYTNTPLALNIYNHYRKHWLARYWQLNGIKVLPTICWTDEKSFAWCFDGEPKHATVAVSSVGTQKRKDEKAAFLQGYDAMMERLEPEKIIFFGKVPEECRGNIIPVEPFYRKFEMAREGKSNDKG